MSSRWKLLLLGLAMAAAGCKESETRTTAEVRPVRTVVADPQPLADERAAVGDIRPRYESDLSFRISGKVTNRYVDVGAVVRAGDLLARVDDQDYRNKLTSAETDVAGAEAVLVEAQAAGERQQKLLAKGFTTQANYDVANKNLRAAEAKLASTKAALKLAHDQVGYCELRAEFDGIVTATSGEPGQVVNVGQMVVRLAKAGSKDAVFSVAEAVLAAHPAGAPRPRIKVGLLSDPAVAAEGEVREVAPIADAATRTFLVKVTLEDPPDQMRFGASVVGRLKSTSAPVVVLPGSALFDKDGAPAVWVVEPSSHAVALKPVTVGRYETDRVVITGGLAKGDIVVTAGTSQLRESQQVALMEGNAP